MSNEQLVGGIEQAQEIPKKLTFNSPETPFKATYQLSDILDETMFDEETMNGARSLKTIQDRLRGLQIIARTPQDAKEGARWQTDQAKVWTVVRYLSSLDSNISMQPETTYGTLSANCLIHVGGELLIGELMDRQRRYAERQGFAVALEPYLQLQDFLVTGRQNRIRIGPCALVDFLTGDPKRKPSPTQAFQFLVGSHLVRDNRSHKAILATEQDPFWSTYPNRAIADIEEITGQVMRLTGAFPEVVSDTVSGAKGLEAEMVQRGYKVYKKIQESRQAFFRTLLDPSLPGFVSAADVLSSYLKQDRGKRTLALSIAGLSFIDQLYGLYRRSQELAAGETNPEFYRLVLDSIDKYIEEVPTSEQVLTIDDLDAIFDEEEFVVAEEKEIPTLDSFGKIISTTFGKTSNYEYDIRSEEIRWQGLISPQDIKIVFNRNRPQQFFITLFYENKEGESRELRLDFDTKKGLFNWNVINATTDPRLVKFRQSAFLATQAVLLQVQTQVEKQYQEKLSARGAQTSVVVERRPKERVRDESYDIRKQVRADVHAITNAGEQTILPDISEEKVKKAIIVPEQETLEELLHSLSSTDKEIIMRGIERFNNESVGEFKKEKRIGKAGVPLYGLRINCTAPKGVRVLMTLSPSSKGVMRFEILDIDYRRNIFRKAGI